MKASSFFIAWAPSEGFIILVGKSFSDIASTASLEIFLGLFPFQNLNTEFKNQGIEIVKLKDIVNE